MKTMNKKIALYALVLLLLPAQVFAVDPVTGGKFFQLDGGGQGQGPFRLLRNRPSATPAAATTLTATLSVSPSTAEAGQPVLVTWSSVGASLCVGRNFATGNAPEGSVILTPAQSTTFTIVCNNASGTSGAPVQKNFTEPQIYANAAFKADILANGNVTSAGRGIFAGNDITVNRICSLLDPGSVAAFWGKRGYDSPEDNTILVWDGINWSAPRVTSHTNSRLVTPWLTCQKSGPGTVSQSRSVIINGVAPTCSLVCSGNSVVNSCTGATVQACTTSCVNASDPTSTGPTSGPASGGTAASASLVPKVTRVFTTTQIYANADFKNDIMVNGGLTLGGNSIYTGNSVAVNRICSVIMPGSVAKTWGARKYSSPEDNRMLFWRNGVWLSQRAGDSTNSHISGSLTCEGPGVPNADGSNPGGPGSNGPGNAYCELPPEVPGVCTPAPVCVGPDMHTQDAECKTTFVRSCAVGCSAGACVGSLPVPDPVVTLTTEPALFRRGNSCKLVFSATNARSCTLTGKGVNSTFGTVTGTLSQTTVSTPPLQNTEPYSLKCTNSAGVSAVKNVDCRILPSYIEI